MSKKGMGKFVLGATVGAALGLLFAPKKGEDTRTDVKKALDDMLAKVKNTSADDIKETVEIKINEIKEGIANLDKETVLSEAKKQAKKLQQAASELVDFAIEKGTPVIESSATAIKKKVTEITAETTKKLEKEKK